MQFSDETLMAYADDEVDADLRRQIEAAMALDPSIAERVAKYRSLRLEPRCRLRWRTRRAHSRPSARCRRLIAHQARDRDRSQRSSRGQGAGRTSATLVLGGMDLDCRQPARWHSRRAHRSACRRAPICLQPPPTASSRAASCRPHLTDQVGDAAKDAKVRIGLTFRATSGDYCRTFVTASAAGFACREPNEWKVRALSEAYCRFQGRRLSHGRHRAAASHSRSSGTKQAGRGTGSRTGTGRPGPRLEKVETPRDAGPRNKHWFAALPAEAHYNPAMDSFARRRNGATSALPKALALVGIPRVVGVGRAVERQQAHATAAPM